MHRAVQIRLQKRQILVPGNTINVKNVRFAFIQQALAFPDKGARAFQAYFLSVIAQDYDSCVD